MKKVNEFFWYCAGARKELLFRAETDSEKYTGIGATIFFTGVFAAIAASYALYTVFDNVLIAIIFGIIWGLMIFNLDRYIVSSMRKKGRMRQELLTAAPRFILAILISLVIAKPLKLKIFEKEINAELVSMKQETIKAQEDFVLEKYSSRKEQLNIHIENLRDEIITKTEERDALSEIARKEADGTGGTMRRNAGPIYEIKKADADRVNQELTELRNKNQKLIDEEYYQLALLDSSINSELDSLIISDIDGPAGRMEALSRLEEKSQAVYMASLFIVFLFILIETAPILVKLISSKGPYDHLLETEEYRFESAVLVNKAYIHSELKKEAESFGDKEKDFVIGRLDLRLDQIS